MLAKRSPSAARKARALLLGLLLTIPALAPAAEPVRLSGSVKDSLGNLLEDVEVLFVPASAQSATPAALVYTDDAGRFVVDRIAPGTYRMAALKKGYLTFVGPVDTLVRESLDVVMRPALAIDPEKVPASASWSLRIPRRGILREVEARPAEAAEVPSRAAGESRLAEDVNVQVEQLFSVGTTAAEPGAESAGMRPTETQMDVASAIGERGRIAVHGRREHFDTPASPQAASAAQSGSAVRLDLSYDTGADGRLDVNAYVDRADYRLSNTATDAPTALEQERRTWGYEATWARQIDPGRRMAFELNYQDLTLTRSDMLSNRALAARGLYERRSGMDHELQVTVETQILELPAVFVAEPGAVADPLDDAVTNWSVLADAQDTWSVAAPFALIYGLGYKQAMAHDANLIVPRFGAAMSSGGWFLRAVLSLHEVAGGDRRGPTTGKTAFRPEDSLGYEASLEVPLLSSLHVESAVRYAPVQVDPMGFAGGTLSAFEHPLYVTDGNAAVREERFALIEDRGESSTYLEVTQGRADGAVAPLLPFGATSAASRGVRVAYRTGRFGMRLPAHGTDVQLEYRRVDAENPPDDGEAEKASEETVELRLRQDLPPFQVPGDWSVLVGVRLGSVESGDVESWDGHGGEESLQALNQRFSAGVSVSF
jgi:hypothetical protein